MSAHAWDGYGTLHGAPLVVELPVKSRALSREELRAAKAMKLSKIAWGKRDEALGKLVCRHVREANPPLVIEYNPISTPRLVRYLRACGINH